MSATATTDGGSAIPWQSLRMYVILGTSAVAVSGVPLVGPALPAVKSAFGVSNVEVGLLMTVYTLPGIALAPVVGAYTDRVGRRPVLLAALSSFGLAGTGIAAVPTFEAVLALRTVQGVAASGLITVALTLVGDAYDGVRRNAVMGINDSAISVASAVTPVLGGVLAGVSWRLPFLLNAVALLLAGLAYVSFDETHVPRDDRDWTGYLRGAVASADLARAAVLYGTVIAVFVLLVGGLFTGLPLMLTELFGESTANVGLVLGATSFGGALVASQNSRFVARWSNATVIVAGLGLSAVAMGLIAAAPTAAAVGGGALLFGAGKGLTKPATDTAISGLVPDEFRAGAMSLRSSFKNVGGTIGPVVVTGASATVGYRGLYLAAGVGAALFAAAIFRYR